jgi:hypothetical protein
MNEGNCKSCGTALHTKHRVTVHPVLSYLPDGSPLRGLEKDVYICGDCVAEDVGAAMGPPPPGVARPASPTPARGPMLR